jgi:hypothetical protein
MNEMPESRCLTKQMEVMYSAKMGLRYRGMVMVDGDDGTELDA